MNFKLEKMFRFEAAHQLTQHDGKCRRLHGHSWVVRLVLEGNALATDGPKRGMLVDYGDVSAAMKPVLEEKLDHHYLNETLPGIYPTSEQLAFWLYHTLKPSLPLLSAVIIEETCTSRCEFKP